MSIIITLQNTQEVSSYKTNLCVRVCVCEEERLSRGQRFHDVGTMKAGNSFVVALNTHRHLLIYLKP